MLLVGIIYSRLLEAHLHQTGAALVATNLLHKIGPVLTTLYWLAFAPHGQLRWSAPLWWCAYPAAYFAYVIERAQFEKSYPYQFMDLSQIGVEQTILNGALILGLFALAGFALVWLDHRCKSRATRG